MERGDGRRKRSREKADRREPPAKLNFSRVLRVTLFYATVIRESIIRICSSELIIIYNYVLGNVYS